MRKLVCLVAVGALSASGVALASGGSATPATDVQAPVARVAAADASLMVDRGNGFESAGAVAMLRAGDVVMASSDTQLVYGDGCSVQVASATPMAALAASPCVDASMVERAAYVQMGGTGGTFNNTFVLGTLGLGLGVLIALLAENDDSDDTPFTP
ncbi:MAG: hypothetical protein ACK4E3_05020 [Brevundimonas sp.]|jgi:hypothetical protein|uniref:hypothetical protein n=1 Tax=Brevundimonas sp. TaxID=1871086 RepID=UPI00391B4A58